jgi:serine/threonine protein kinase
MRRNCVISEAFTRKTKVHVIIKGFKKTGMTETRRESRQRELDAIKAAAAVPNVMRLIGTIEDEDNYYTVVNACPGTSPCIQRHATPCCLTTLTSHAPNTASWVLTRPTVPHAHAPALAPGVTLIELMADSGGHLPEAHVARSIAAPLLRAVAGLHSLGIAHRHIRPEHILVSLAATNLIDFTDCADMRMHCLNSRIGELQYMAPEMLTKPRAEDVFHQVGCGRARLQGGEGRIAQQGEKHSVSASCRRASWEVGRRRFRH